MLSKVFITGKTFMDTCRYVCEDLTRAQVLEAHGVRGHDYNSMAQDFEVQHQFWPEKEKPVFHAALTFPRGEKPRDDILIAITRDYLQKIEMKDTQYAVVKHTDKQHLHLHIVANRIDDNGGIIGKGLIIERGIKAARELTNEYHLKQEHGKNLALTNMEALHPPDAVRYKIYQAIRKHLPGCYRMEELERRLMSEGISMRYRYDPGTKERQGVSFRTDSLSFAGYRVDPECTLRGLQQQLSTQQEQVLRQQLNLAKLTHEKEQQQQQQKQGQRQRQSLDLDLSL
jgi:hypothetical protein